jgi:hypothetical protein
METRYALRHVLAPLRKVADKVLDKEIVLLKRRIGMRKALLGSFGKTVEAGVDRPGRTLVTTQGPHPSAGTILDYTRWRRIPANASPKPRSSIVPGSGTAATAAATSKAVVPTRISSSNCPGSLR